MAGVEGEDDSLPERRLLLIGKTGNGKSSLGNIILGRRQFTVGCSMSATTVKVDVGEVNVDGRKMKVVDTPDITNIGLIDDNVAQQEVGKWKALTSPDVHAILLVVRCDVRYTREEQEIFLKMKKLWGGNSLSRRLMVAFTFGDRQDGDIKEDLKMVCPELQSVLKEASHRYLLFNDKDTDEAKMAQVTNLIKMVETLDHELQASEDSRFLNQIQVCPQGPCTGLPSTGPIKDPLSRSASDPVKAAPSLSRTTSGGSTGSGSLDRGQDTIRLLLIGKAGTGKSSTGNTIIGRGGFPVHPSDQTVEVHIASKHNTNIDERHLQVIDTPGLQSSDPDKKYKSERRRASELILPGPHAVLYVVRHGAVTDDDLTGYRRLKEQLGQGLAHHTVVVLVGGPAQPFPPPPSAVASSQSPDGGVQHEEGEVFSLLLQEAGGKLWRVNNAPKDPGSRNSQVQPLMKIISSILDNSGGECFYGDKLALEKAKASKQGKDKRSSGSRNSNCWFL